MAQVDEIPKTYQQAVRALARWNGEAGADDLIIFAADDIGDNMVRLIHVSEQFPELGGVRVYRLGASAEFPFRSAIALARPEQWATISSGDSDQQLPDDWKLEHVWRVWPATAKAPII